MSTHPRDYGKGSSFKREHDDNDLQRRKGDNEDRYGHPDRRHGTSQSKENPRHDGERRRDRRDHPEDRRSYGREYDDRRRGEVRELDGDRDRESRRDRDGDRDFQTRNDRRHRESSRDRARQSRRSASPKRRSQSPTRSKSPADKTKPNFNPSGLLAAATNTVKAADGTSTVLKYNEPPEARKPTLGWRLYVFKGNEQTGDLVAAYSRSSL
jgi:smad nuclear-interacting protein 1